MDNLVTLCLIGILVVVGLMLLPRLLRGFGGPDYSQRGNINPQYDDPNINSRGAFGRPAGGERPTYDSPNIISRGMFGRSRGSSGSSQRQDSPNIQSRGSFGRSKK